MRRTLHFSTKPHRVNIFTMSTLNKTLNNRFLTSLLEVERKFVPTPALKGLINESSKPQTFYLSAIPISSRKLLTRLTRKLVTDKYYDRKGQLESHGIWVRWRKEQVTKQDGTDAQPAQGFWEAKVKQDGDFVDSKFIEVQGRDAVENVMDSVGVCDSIFDLKLELGFMADRVSWNVKSVEGEGGKHYDHDDATMTLIIDTVIASLEGPNGEYPKNFAHQVGELELQKPIVTTSHHPNDHPLSSTKHSRLRAAEGDKMHEQLETFMDSHPEIFAGEGKPVGKLTAYIKHRKEQAERAWKANESGRIANMSEIKWEREINGKG